MNSENFIIDTWNSSLSLPLTSPVPFYLLHPVCVSPAATSLSLAGSCALPFAPHLNIPSRLLLLLGHISISTWMSRVVVVMIPEGNQEPFVYICYFLELILYSTPYSVRERKKEDKHGPDTQLSPFFMAFHVHSCSPEYLNFASQITDWICCPHISNKVKCHMISLICRH